MRITTLILAIFTLTAFATNSLLCRQALMTESIGPVEFTIVRLASGMIMLSPLILFRRQLFRTEHGDALSSDSTALLKIQPSTAWPALALFCYAIFFSLAYIQLDAGAGALILFASVQITMIGVSIVMGNRVGILEWVGIAISIFGLVYLLLPGLSAPPALGTILMVFSGVSWGVYSLLGRSQAQPIFSTARNFLFCLPGVAILALIAYGKSIRSGQIQLTTDGIFLAVISGAAASGMGYVLWYLTVRRITTTVASVCQLVVPILAALGGILFLGESLTLRFVVASALIVGGIIVTIAGRRVSVQTTNLQNVVQQQSEA